MTISYTGSITTGISAYTPADGCTNEPANTALVVGNDNFLKTYNLTTLTFTASFTCLSSPAGVCLITPATAVVVSNSVSTVDFIEINVGSRTNVSGGSTLSSFVKTQMIAADPTQGIALACSGTSTTMTKISSSQTVSTFHVAISDANAHITTVIYKSPGRWLCGTDIGGQIVEVDSSGTVHDSFTLNYSPNNSNNFQEAVDSPTITNMSLDNNLLLVATNIAMFLIDYSTKTVIKTVPFTGTTSTYSATLCQGSSGETVFARNYATASNQVIHELDYTVNPVQTRSALYTNATNRIIVGGLNSTNGTGWAIQQNTAMFVFNIAPRASTTRTVTVQNNSVDQLARLVLIDDTNGTGNSQILLDTYMQSPGTYRVPTGKTIKELVKVGSGANALWDLSNYST